MEGWDRGIAKDSKLAWSASLHSDNFKADLHNEILSVKGQGGIHYGLNKARLKM